MKCAAIGCSNEFIVPLGSGRNKKFCSKTCSNRAYLSRIHQQVLERRSTLLPIKCANDACSTMIVPYPVGGKIKKYCCRKCSVNQRLRVRPITAEARQRYEANANKKYRLNPRGRFCKLRACAKTRHIEFKLTEAEYNSLIQNQQCFYCKGPLFLPWSTMTGVDRYDFKKGYLLENCRPCCWKCNERKGRIESAGFQPKRAVELLQELIQGDRNDFTTSSIGVDGGTRLRSGKSEECSKTSGGSCRAIEVGR